MINVRASAKFMPVQNSQQIMVLINKTLLQMQESAQKMIILSIEAKTIQGKNQLLGKLVGLSL